MEYVTLNNGVKMPQVGLGTFLIPEDKLIKTIGQAYELGYRQFDTAWRYHNERTIARALKENGIKRSDVFITTKINADALYTSDYKYGLHSFFNRRNGKSIDDVIEESFENLDTEYIDLFLIHWPWPMCGKMYQALEKQYLLGRIKAIGVSNFLPPHIEYLREFSDIVPAVKQFEISPLNTNKGIISYCREKNIAVEAMSTFSHYRSVEPRAEIFNNKILLNIAQRHNRLVVQVVLRWFLQQNIIMIPKTWETKHLKENISIFDFKLSEEEMTSIDTLNEGKFLNYIPLGEQYWLPKKYWNWPGFKEWEKYNSPDSFSEKLKRILRR